MSPRVEQLRNDVRRRYRRTFLGMIFLGFATIVLGATVGWVVAVNSSQDAQLKAVSACADDPSGIECIKGHAVSVSKTTHAEACFILAQGGRRCAAKPLPDAEVYRNRLLAEADAITPDDESIYYEAMPDQPASTGRASTPTSPSSSPVSDEPESPSVPRSPRTPRPPAPSPSPTPEPSPEPAAPVPATRPLVDLPDPLGVCVNALGISVAC